MQIDRTKYLNWRTILIDTGVLFAFFASKKEGKDAKIQFIGKLLSHLSKYQTGEKEDRRILISTITLSELLTKESGQDKINRVLKVLDSDNVEFLSFDIETALEFNVRLQPYLERDALHAKAMELGFERKDLGMAREWISKDYMIAMTGITKKVDVILTLDKKTFYPICQDFPDTKCILAYPELFKHSEQYIFEYDYGNVDNFLKGIPFKTLNEIEVESTPGEQQSLFGKTEQAPEAKAPGEI
jgi:hypothetical protein